MEIKWWYEPKSNTPKEQCPCCDYISLPERWTYLICPICFWEDEYGIDVDNIDEISWPNHISLREARENFKDFWACDKNMIKNVISIEERKKYTKRERSIN